jgi:xylan 1,4-beta-xylosidase
MDRASWAFEFEDQPYFDGFRTLATNGIDLPVLLSTATRSPCIRPSIRKRLRTGVDAMIKNGVGAEPYIDAVATKSDHAVSVLMWNYHDDDVSAPDAPVRVTITGVPASVHRVLLSHYRIDRDHSNSYTVSKQMGSPQSPTAERLASNRCHGNRVERRRREILPAKKDRKMRLLRFHLR